MNPQRRDLTESILAWGDLAPDAVALSIRGQQIGFAELQRAAYGVSHRLQSDGYAVGDAVGVYLRTSVAFVATYLGIQHAGMVPLVLNAMLRPSELTDIFARVGPVAVFVEEEFRDRAEQAHREIGQGAPALWAIDSDQPLASTHPEAAVAPPRRVCPIAALGMTSATTGRAKAVRISHHSITVSAWWCAWTMDLQPGGVVLSSVPTFYDMGFHTASLPALHLHNTVVIQERYEADGLVSSMQRWRPNVLVGTPTMHRRTVREMERRGLTEPSVRVVFSSGSGLDPDTVERLYERFPNVRVRQLYGLTESRQVSSSGIGDDPPLDSVGRPAPGVAVRLVGQEGVVLTDPGQVGEIQARSAGVTDGYETEVEEQPFAPGGWLRTGDLGRFDEDGWLYFVGREKEMIVRGGANVYPREIELAAGRFAGVSEVAVIGRPNPDLDEIPVLFYSTDPDENVAALDLERHCREVLAAYKVPVSFVEIDEIPKQPSGKVDKGSLVQLDQDGREEVS